MSKATRTTDPVQVRLGHFGEVKVNDDVHSLHVYAARKQVTADEVPAQALSEVVEHAVPVRLRHFCVYVVAAVAELGDLLGEQLHALRRIAEDDRLVDLQLREERVQAVHLLALLHERVVLRHALQRQLLHQVDLVRLAQVLLHEVLQTERECGGEEQDLALLRQLHDDMVQHALEVLRQQLVRLVQHEHLALRHVRHLLVHQVEDATGRRDDQLHLLVDAHDVVLEVRAARRHHHADVHVLGQFDADLRRLQGQFARRHNDQRLNVLLGRVDLLQHWNTIRARFARTVLGTRQNVFAAQRNRNGRLLDGRRLLPALLEDAH